LGNPHHTFASVDFAPSCFFRQVLFPCQSRAWVFWLWLVDCSWVLTLSPPQRDLYTFFQTRFPFFSPKLKKLRLVTFNRSFSRVFLVFPTNSQVPLFSSVAPVVMDVSPSICPPNKLWFFQCPQTYPATSFSYKSPHLFRFPTPARAFSCQSSLLAFQLADVPTLVGISQKRP